VIRVERAPTDAKMWTTDPNSAAALSFPRRNNPQPMRNHAQVLKIHPVLLLGGITGSMTSGASLSVVTSAAKSPMRSLGYTGACAFANVLLTIAGSLVLYF
jgi:hypothetical protein